MAQDKGHDGDDLDDLQMKTQQLQRELGVQNCQRIGGECGWWCLEGNECPLCVLCDQLNHVTVKRVIRVGEDGGCLFR